MNINKMSLKSFVSLLLLVSVVFAGTGYSIDPQGTNSSDNCFTVFNVPSNDDVVNSRLEVRWSNKTGVISEVKAIFNRGSVGENKTRYDVCLKIWENSSKMLCKGQVLKVNKERVEVIFSFHDNSWKFGPFHFDLEYRIGKKGTEKQDK